MNGSISTFLVSYHNNFLDNVLSSLNCRDVVDGIKEFPRFLDYKTYIVLNTQNMPPRNIIFLVDLERCMMDDNFEHQFKTMIRNYNSLYDFDKKYIVVQKPEHTIDVVSFREKISKWVVDINFSFNDIFFVPICNMSGLFQDIFRELRPYIPFSSFLRDEIEDSTYDSDAEYSESYVEDPDTMEDDEIDETQDGSLNDTIGREIIIIGPEIHYENKHTTPLFVSEFLTRTFYKNYVVAETKQPTCWACLDDIVIEKFKLSWCGHTMCTDCSTNVDKCFCKSAM